jgi:hypothetical protein
MQICDTCAHSRPRKPGPTYYEEWVADKRPERPKGFLGWLKWRFNPSAYKKQSPYADTGRYGMGKYYKAHDRTELRFRDSYLTCTLLPRHIEVIKVHFCSHYQPRPLNKDNWIMGNKNEKPN